MGILGIKWGNRAFSQFYQIVNWYEQECGRAFSIKFYRSVHDTLNLVAKMPTIGIVDERRSKGKRLYRSVLVNPKYRIVYRYDDKSIYVVAIHCNLRKG